MRYTAKYIGFTALCKSGLKKKPAGIIRHVATKDTLSFLITVILRNFAGFIKSLFDFMLNDFRNAGIQDLNYLLNKQYELIIMPSYCEKPANCPDRYEIYCRGMNGKCDNDCRFRHYKGFTDKAIHYRFMTHDRGVADMLEYSLQRRMQGVRVIALMSTCRFAADIASLFPVFNLTVLIMQFKSGKGQCMDVMSFFNGDMGNNMNVNAIDSDYEGILNLLISNIHRPEH